MNKIIELEDLGMVWKDGATAKRRYGRYKCYCGKEFECLKHSITSGRTKSCGCLHHEVVSNMNKTHGLGHTKLYGRYMNMLSRTNDVRNKQYKDYGGRGISVCQEWKDDFMAFYNWALISGYKEELTIDRIDNDGNYEPNNCRWVDRHTQQANRRTNIATNKSGYAGIVWQNDRQKWASQIGNKGKVIGLGRFHTKKEALEARNKYIIDNNLQHKIQTYKEEND